MSDGAVRDRIATLIAAFGFSLSLGIATVAVPLLALASGYDAAAVGLLTATSAISQLTTRLALPWLLGRFADRTLIAAGAALMAAAFGLLLLSTTAPVFVAAQLLQGGARGVFWTTSQTHAVRAGGPPIRRLVDMNLAGNAGTLTGPALAGVLAASAMPLAIGAALIAAALGLAGAIFLRRLPPFDRRRSVGTWHLLRREGVDVASWASAMSGGWWAMLGSFIPVLFVAAGLGPNDIGWLVTASEAAGAVAMLALRGVAAERISRAVWISGAIVGIALAGIAVAPAQLLVYGALLLVGGAASGALITLAPAMASLAAGPDEQGDALALAGTFRAGALLAAPAAASGLLALTSVSGAVVIVAAALGLPGALLGRRGTRTVPVA
jgi:MFS family permease